MATISVKWKELAASVWSDLEAKTWDEVAYKEANSVNKVEVNGKIIIDLTGDTVDEEHVLSGYTFHDKSGVQLVGTATAAGAVSKPEQEKTVAPTTEAQTIKPDEGYTLSAVTVSAIQTEEKTVTQNGTVTPTEGKYLASVSVAIPYYEGW